MQSTSCYLTRGIYCNELKTGLLYVYIHRYHARPFITPSVRAPKTARDRYTILIFQSVCVMWINIIWTGHVSVYAVHVYQRVRSRTYYSRLHKLGYSSNIETTRENGFGITMYLCCVIVKRTCQHYGVDRSRHTMTLFFFYSRTIGCQGDFLF